MKQTRVNKVSYEIITQRYVRRDQVSKELGISAMQLKYLIKVLTGRELMPHKGKPGKISVEEYELVKRMKGLQKKGFGLASSVYRLGIKFSSVPDEVEMSLKQLKRLMKTFDQSPKEHFRLWMNKTYGRQDANDYAGTFTEDIAIIYAQEVAKDAWERAIKEFMLVNACDVIHSEIPPYQPKQEKP